MIQIGGQCRFLILSCLLLLFSGSVRCEDRYTSVKDNILDISTYNLGQHDTLIEVPELWNVKKHNSTENVSGHKDLTPLHPSDFIGFSLAAVGLLIAAGGGIGGGGILVPIYTLVLHFTPKYAIPLANVSVLGGAVANVILNLGKRHPDADRPLVDWDLILIMEPLTIAGALVGGILNKLLPEWLITILLVVVLSFTAYRALKKGKSLYDKENEKREQERTQAMEQSVQTPSTTTDHDHEIHSDLEMEDTNRPPARSRKTAPYEGANNSLEEVPVSRESMTESMTRLLLDDSVDDANAVRRKKLLEQERKVSWRIVLAIFVMFGVVVAINVLKGGGAKPSPIGIVCGTVWFWLAQCLLLLWIFIVAFCARVYLTRRNKLKEEVDFPFVEGDIKWDGRATIIYPIICSAAGLCAGMFGIGGGIVKGPLMLAMGVHPMVAAATSATMILFTSFTATTTFVVFGLLQYDYAVVLLIIGFIATLIGQTLMNYLVKKSGRNSYIVFIIGTVVALSAVLMLIQSFLVVKKTRQGHGTPDSGICGVGA